MFFELYKSYDLHAVLTIISVVTQTIYLALHREWRNPLWRWGAIVAVFFSCISFLSWESHFTITRHALPITLVFNLLLAMRPTRSVGDLVSARKLFRAIRHSLLRWHAGISLPARLPNLSLKHRMARWPRRRSNCVHRRVMSASSGGRQITSWWARGEVGHDQGPQHVVASDSRPFCFLTRSFHLREFAVTFGAKPIFRGRLLAARQVCRSVARIRPGESTLHVYGLGQTSKTDDGTPGDVTFKIERPEDKTDCAVMSRSMGDLRNPDEQRIGRAFFLFLRDAARAALIVKLPPSLPAFAAL